MNELRIAFGILSEGWLELTISNQNQRITLDISDVPCDSINELAKIFVNLQSGSKIEEVEFSLEPDFALWRFISFEDEMQIHVFPNANRDKPVMFKENREKLLNRIYQALKDLEKLPCWQDHNNMINVWSWKFPSEILNDYRHS